MNKFLLRNILIDMPKGRSSNQWSGKIICSLIRWMLGGLLWRLSGKIFLQMTESFTWHFFLVTKVFENLSKFVTFSCFNNDVQLKDLWFNRFFFFLLTAAVGLWNMLASRWGIHAGACMLIKSSQAVDLRSP